LDHVDELVYGNVFAQQQVAVVDLAQGMIETNQGIVMFDKTVTLIKERERKEIEEEKEEEEEEEDRLTPPKKVT